LPNLQRTGSLKLVKIGNGLFTCPSCQERLVVTWSGHYVRDPFNGKQYVAHSTPSEPTLLELRDFGFVKRPCAHCSGSAILFGVSIITLESLNSQQNGVQGLLEQVTEIDPPEKSP